MNVHPDVESYLAAAPGEQRPLLIRLRELLRGSLPQAQESFESRMPVYLVNGTWTAGFAHRKKGAMLYIMKPELLDEFSAELGPCRNGRTCIEMAGRKSHSTPQLEQLAARILEELARRLRT